MDEGKLREAGRLAAPKLVVLRQKLRGLGSALIAFSGGVDSTFVLRIAKDELGDSAVALTALSASVAKGERKDAEELARLIGVKHVLVDSDELQDPSYAANPSNRCYFCKKELYALCAKERAALGLQAIVDGFNADDMKDHRPGQQAAKEREIVSPLALAGLTKDEIRGLSLELGLPTWDKPQMPCLASRIPYGTKVTEPRLLQIGAAESALRELGLRTFRVRYHGDIARLEVSVEEQPRFHSEAFRGKVTSGLKALGFKFVVLDLEPFRSGRLNEAAGISPAMPQ